VAVQTAGTAAALARFTEAEQILAREKAHYVQLVMEAAERGKIREDLAAQVVASRTELFPHLVRGGQGGTSLLSGTKAYRNFRQWRDLLRIDGKPACDRFDLLCRNYATGRREQTATAEHPFIRLVAGFYETENRLDLAHAYHLACEAVRAQRLHPEILLSESQVDYYYKHIKDRQALYLARHGEDAFRQDMCGWIDRDWSGVPPGYCWVGDHHQFDAPCRYIDDTGVVRACRPWWTVWMDNRALFFVGWVVRAGEHPDSFAIEDAFLEGTRANGNMPPSLAYTDNGKDYRSKGFADPVIIEDGGRRFEYSILQALGVRRLTALAYNARAKVIEREFREVARQFSKYWYGYLGNRPGNRPERGNEAWQHPETLPSLQEFTEALSWWLTNVYHKTSGKRSKITGGRPPCEVWAERTPLRDALTDGQLRMAMLKPYARNPLVMVGRGGRLQVDGRVYQSPELWPLTQQRVLVKIDRLDERYVYAYQPDGRLICEVRKVETVPALDDSPETRALISEKQKAVRRQLTRARAIQMQDNGGTLPSVAAPIARLQLADPTVTPSATLAAAHRLALTPTADSAGASGVPSTGRASPAAESAPRTQVDPDIDRATQKALFGAAAKETAHDTLAPTDAAGAADTTAAAPEQAGTGADAVLQDVLARIGL
jgi:hypothetical protein